FETLANDVPLPCIIHWEMAHFVVVYKIRNDKVYVSDPAYGLIVYKKEDFINRWIGYNADASTEEGISLLLEPTPAFNQNIWEGEEKEKKGSFSFLFQYLFRYKGLL